MEDMVKNIQIISASTFKIKNDDVNRLDSGK